MISHIDEGEEKKHGPAHADTHTLAYNAHEADSAAIIQTLNPEG